MKLLYFEKTQLNPRTSKKRSIMFFSRSRTGFLVNCSRGVPRGFFFFSLFSLFFFSFLFFFFSHAFLLPVRTDEVRRRNSRFALEPPPPKPAAATAGKCEDHLRGLRPPSMELEFAGLLVRVK
ncbi:unnamed protein product [Cuscuta europaea]|uniref:Transmembrane protein n=1 Tax=Cuscuta europaea TaxID=41803 RepID=A0A9P0Z559_CUSEU|nr:unnamed protein product [Cuscuta europaea]